MRPISLMMAALILVMSDRSLAQDCLLGYVTPMHGDPARGHGTEKDWDGGGGAGFPDPAPAPR